jgi:uncharacterized protein (TIGR00106 family)
MDSVLVEFSIFPTDKGESKSEYVSKILEMVKQSGVNYKLTPMSTIIETSNMSDALKIIETSYELLDDCNRIYSTIKIDFRRNKSNRIVEKINSVEKRIGEVSK